MLEYKIKIILEINENINRKTNIAFKYEITKITLSTKLQNSVGTIDDQFCLNKNKINLILKIK